MTNIRLNIENLWETNPSVKDYGVMLTETHPTVKFKANKAMVVESYLWYPFQKTEQHEMFTSYYAEKLSVQNESTALQLIADWNMDIQANTLEKVTFDRVIEFGKIRFGVLHDYADKGSIVMMNCTARYPWEEERVDGYGNTWAYLDAGVPPSDSELKKYFNLSKSQSKTFRLQW